MDRPTWAATAFSTGLGDDAHIGLQSVDNDRCPSCPSRQRGRTPVARLGQVRVLWLRTGTAKCGRELAKRLWDRKTGRLSGKLALGNQISPFSLLPVRSDSAISISPQLRRGGARKQKTGPDVLWSPLVDRHEQEGVAGRRGGAPSPPVRQMHSDRRGRDISANAEQSAR